MSDRRRLLLLVGLAIVLSAGLLIDRLLSGGVPEAGSEVATELAALAGGNPLAGRVRSDVAALFERPLFDPARQSLMAPPPQPAEDVEAAMSQPPPEPRLDGIVIGPDLAGAYIALPGAPVTFVKTGERLGDWHLRTVNREGVTLDGPGGALRLSAPVPSP